MSHITSIPKHHKKLSKHELIALYSRMVHYRRFEEAAARSYGMGKIHGFCHLHIGQEAITTAIAATHQKGDAVIGGYRTHTLALAMGVHDEEVMCELYGKAPGNVHGLGGSMHLFQPETGFYGGWGLVGQQLPTANGLAFAQKYNDSPNATLCLIGDGAVHQGAVHESLNLASVWDLPLIVLIENNHYGMGTAVDRISALPPLHELAGPYNIDHWEVDGMDALAMYDSLYEAFERARQNRRPCFVEAKCSRFRGHSMSDPGKYRTKEELKAEKGRDPIPTLGNLLIDEGHLSKEELQKIDDDAKTHMKKITKIADDAPTLEPDKLTSFIFAQGGHHE